MTGVAFPTILVADENGGVRNSLVRDLQHEGYFVLVAQDGPEAIQIVRVHSRPIHLMLTGESIDGRTLAATIKKYRPNMRVLFITRFAKDDDPDVLRYETALAKVREFVTPPGISATKPMEVRHLPERAHTTGK